MISETSTYADHSNAQYLDKKKILQQFNRFHTTVQLVLDVTVR